jgi:NTP pyrophosphohydrolases including oxidative damage repair enzymes
MKKKIKLTSRILLINKKFKTNQYYHYLTTPNVTIIVPEIKKKFIIVSQKREPINKINYEFPSGQIDENESPARAAARELFEETGYKSIRSPNKY